MQPPPQAHSILEAAVRQRLGLRQHTYASPTCRPYATLPRRPTVRVMFSIGKLTAAQGFDYLLRGVAHGAEDYYARDEQVGEAPGRWVASSEALLGLTGEVTDEAFRAVYGEHADPRTGETLGRTRRVYRSVAERLAEARARLEGEAAREGRAVSSRRSGRRPSGGSGGPTGPASTPTI